MIKISAEHVCQTVLNTRPNPLKNLERTNISEIFESEKAVEFQQASRNWLNREGRHVYVTETHLRIADGRGRERRRT